jgi:peptide/nickel transport system substrate-binding protein
MPARAPSPALALRRTAPLLAVLVLAAVAVAALARSAEGKQAGGASGGTFVLTNLSDPDPIDPALVSHTMSRTFVRNVYEPLVYYRLGTTKIQPVLARGWKRSANGLTYTFTLRQGVKFHDGSAFDSADVVATIQRDLVLKSGVGGSYLKDVRGVRAQGPSTAVITLKRRNEFFLGQLPKIPIASAEDIAAHRGSDYAQGWFKDNANGTGPWKLESYRRGTQYTLVRNPGYWRPFRANAFDRIIVRPVGDSAVQAQLIARGEVNMGSWMSVRDMIQAAKAPNVKLFNFRSPMTLVGALNGGRAPLDNLKIRQAILAAFPYAQLRGFYQGYAQAPRHVLSPSYPGAAHYPVLKQDLDKARRLLREGGRPGGGFTLRYVAVQGLEDERQAGLLLQDALKQIGVTLKIDVLPFATFFQQAQNPRTAPDISPGYEAPETNNPFEWFAKLFACDGFLNFSHFCVKALDRTIAQAQATSSTAQQRRLLVAAQKLIADNAFMIPMSNFNAVYAGPTWLGGFQQDITDLLSAPKFFGMYRIG